MVVSAVDGSPERFSGREMKPGWRQLRGWWDPGSESHLPGQGGVFQRVLRISAGASVKGAEWEKESLEGRKDVRSAADSDFLRKRNACQISSRDLHNPGPLTRGQ